VAAYRIQQWWRGRIKGGRKVSLKVHKRVLKAGLRFRNLVKPLQEANEKAKLEARDPC
jgi:hypothetical protein